MLRPVSVQDEQCTLHTRVCILWVNMGVSEDEAGRVLCVLPLYE